MKNLYSNKDLYLNTSKYKTLGVQRDLAERIYTSRLLGSNKELVLHGGGNTSVKSKAYDIDGNIHDVIYVKGSGSDLGSIGPQGFPAVKIKPLKNLMNKDFITDEQMVNYIRKNLIDILAPNPSVETLVHAVIEEKFVDHTHSNAILEICNRPDGMKLCKQLFSSDYEIVPYVMPGYILAKKIYELYSPEKKLNGLILFRHGIFTFGNTAKLSYDRMIEATTTAEKFLKKQKTKKITKIPRKRIKFQVSDIANILKSQICVNRNYILNFRTSDEIISAINSEKIAMYLNKGVITPDHVIRTKPKPLIMNLDSCNSLSKLNKKIITSVASYRNKYVKYFNKHNKPKKSFSILDPVPNIILIQNLGMFSVGRNLKESLTNGDVSEMSIKTILRIQEKASFQSISARDIFNVEYWSLEQAKLNKIEKPLASKVVIVTGGAGTIGLKTAKKFSEKGAEVIIIDNNKKKLNELLKHTYFKSYICDVTNRKDFKKVIKDISLIYGGVDILISNAGSAFQAKIAHINDKDLIKSFNLNFFAHQVVASETVKVMINQNIGGCILFNISKQAINPGREFGAYGTAKAALLALCKQYALENGEFGIRANGVNADRIQSGLLTENMIQKRALARNLSTKDYMEGNLLQKQVLPEDVANAFYYLAISEKTTAAIYTVDGGNIEASLR